MPKIPAKKEPKPQADPALTAKALYDLLDGIRIALVCQAEVLYRVTSKLGEQLEEDSNDNPF